MSLFAKLFGGGEKTKHYTEGLALFEDGRYAEAADRLREAVAQGGRAPSSPLASFYLRQALVAEARRLLAANRPEAAVPYLEELVAGWDRFPDHQFLLGTAQGLAGDWENALRAAGRALRLNGEYTEARLLEACSLQQLERLTEAAASLDKLIAQGRWTEHWVLNELTLNSPVAADGLPEGLPTLLQRAAAARPQQQELAEAVALCRAGEWGAGADRFAHLVAKHPRYPDYRVKHAAALYQIEQVDEALAEVERATALNPQYRAAIVLKTLLLADSGRIGAAWRYLSEQIETEVEPAVAGHEQLLASYLQGVLALLTGQPTACRDALRGWDDLARSFARAELLLAAADDLNGQGEGCRWRLATLAEIWPTEPDYTYFLGLYLLQTGRDQEVAQLLGRWPADPDGDDPRPVYLSRLLALRQGQAPTEAAAVTRPPGTVAAIAPPAWEYLAARTAFAANEATTCHEICDRLLAAGWATEPVVRLWAEAAARLAAGTDVGLAELPPVVPQRVVAPRAAWLWLADKDDAAEQLVEHYRVVHPDWLPGHWLSARFWLAPVRRWLG